MGRNKEKKTIRQRFLDWWLPVVALVLIIGAGRSFYLWSDRNYGQLTTSLITVLGVVVTLWMTQVRAIEQQEREDKRHHARLEAEAEMHDERLRVESEREHERLTAEAQKDRAQRSITQRIDLAEKLASAVEHLSSENELKQAAGVQEILFQIDDWHALIKSEITGIEGKEPENSILIEESLRRRQEIFDIAYKFDTDNVELLKSRARGLKQRLVGSDDHSLIGLDFSGMVIGWPELAGEDNFRIDLEKINANNFIISNSEMCYVDLSYAHFVGADFSHANLYGAVLSGAHFEGADFSEANLHGADLSEAHLKGAHFSHADLEGADFSGADRVLFVLWSADLVGADFSEAHLKGAHFSQVNLESADFSEANLHGADFSEAHLKRAHFLYADLEGADFSEAHLHEADLSGAHLQGVDLKNAGFDLNVLRDKKLLNDAEYDDETKFPDWLDPNEYGMRLVDKTEYESCLFSLMPLSIVPSTPTITHNGTMTHQSGITALGTTDHVYLELDLVQGKDPKEAIGRLAAAINLPTTVSANAVVGVRPELWAKVSDAQHVPNDVHGFNEPLKGADGYEMPATQHDAWVWVASFSRSQSFEVSSYILKQLKGYFKLADETVGWAYELNRDLTGFEDGTENPGALEAPGLVGVPAGQPGAGSSVLLFQKWSHRIREWSNLSVDRQQDVIGRTKQDSTELPEDAMPDSSHVSRTVVEKDGEEQDVFRRNTSYGELENHGTTFVGFSFEQWRLEEMLRQMAGADGGPRDALTYFTDAETGSWYVCPSVAGLLAIAEPFMEDDDD